MTQTLSETVTIVNKKGLHARAAARFVKLAGSFDSQINVSRAGQEVDGCSIMGLLTLAAAQGREIQLTCQGPDATKALHALSKLIQDGFYEKDDGQ